MRADGALARLPGSAATRLHSLTPIGPHGFVTAFGLIEFRPRGKPAPPCGGERAAPAGNDALAAGVGEEASRACRNCIGGQISMSP